MSYAQHFTELARGLGRLSVEGSEGLTAAEFDVALTARSAVLELLTAVHRDLTGISPRAVTATAADIQAHPVAAFARALAEHPRIPSPSSPSDVLIAVVAGPAGRTWQEVARHAVLAGHEWATGHRTPMDGMTAWRGVADVTAVGGLLADLDRDLAAVAASLPGRDHEAAQLDRATTSGLEVVAREATRLADAGPLGAAPDRISGPDRLVVPVRSATDLVDAEQRLASLLRTSSHLRPERHHLITLGHARVCAAVAEALHDTGQPTELALGKDLRRHVELLHNVAQRPAVLGSVLGGDPLPLRQAAEIHQTLTRSLTAETDPALLVRLIPALADTTAALAEVAERHLHQGSWLVPDTTATDKNPTTGAWTPVVGPGDIPARIHHLHEASTHATAMIQTAVTAGASTDRRPASDSSAAQRPTPPDGRSWRPALPERLPSRPATPAHPLGTHSAARGGRRR